jgi:hypothetical protein
LQHHRPSAKDPQPKAPYLSDLDPFDFSQLRFQPLSFCRNCISVIFTVPDIRQFDPLPVNFFRLAIARFGELIGSRVTFLASLISSASLSGVRRVGAA